MASTEGESVPNEVGYGTGVPSPAEYGVWGSVVSSSSRVRGRAPAENGFWHILKAKERSFFHPYYKNQEGGAICISIPSPNSDGTCLPRLSL